MEAEIAASRSPLYHISGAPNHPISFTRQMLSRLFSLLLVAFLSLCPLFCNAGPSRGSDKHVGCGCCHSAAGHGPSKHSCPGRDSSGGAGKGCQCICGGAVVTNVAEIPSAIDTSFSIPVAESELLPRIVDAVTADHFVTAPWPDDGVNVGRTKCCLFSTLLC